MCKFLKKLDFGIVLPLVTMMLVLVLLIGFTVGETKSANTEDWSLYRVSSAAATFLNAATAPSGASGAAEDVRWKDTVASVAGNAGGFLGYSDQNKTPGVSGWISSALSGSSSSYSVDLFTGGEFEEYIRFGSLLSTLNFDDVGSALSINMFRYVSGFIMMCAYAAAVSVDIIFDCMFTLLSWLNPFRWFANISTDGLNSFTAANMGGGFDSGSAMGKVQYLVEKLYRLISNLAWEVTIPVLFVSLIVSFVLLKNTNKGNMLKKYIIRVAFIAIGIPLCGALYTSALTELSQFDVGSMGASQVVLSTYVDFEAWVENCRLGFPDDVCFEVDVNWQPTGKTYNRMRENCFAINAQSYNVNVNYQLDNSIDLEKVESVDPNDTDSRSCWNLLLRYMVGEFYYASDFETGVKGKLTSREAENYISAADDVKDYKLDGEYSPIYEATDNKLFSNGCLDIKKIGTQVVISDGNPDAEIEGLGDWITEESPFLGIRWEGYLYNRRTGSWIRDPRVTQYTEVKTREFIMDNEWEGYDYNCDSSGDGLNERKHGGLSTMSMYNYLSTTFGSTNAVVYSSEKAASAAIRESHYSVNLIGDGFSGALFWLNSVVVLFAFAIIGWGYAFSILFVSIRRGLNMVMSVPFAIMGGLHAIAKVCTYTVMMILEIVMSYFAYSLVQALLLGLSDLCTQVLTSLFAALTIFGGVLGLIIGLVVPIVIFIWFVGVALKLRKSMVKMADEWIAQFLEKFIIGDTIPLPASKPGMLKQVAGAAATGAGMAAGRRLMGGQSGSDTKNPGADKSGSVQYVATGNGASGSSASGASSVDAAGGTGMPGGSGAGKAASMATDAAFGDSKQDMHDRTAAEHMEALMPGGDSAKNADEKKRADELRADAMIDSATGKTSAIEDEQNFETKKDIEKNERKAGQTQAAMGIVETGVGIAEIIGGAYSEDPELAKDGVENVIAGVESANSGQQRADKASQTAQSTVDQQQLEKNVDKDGSSELVNDMNRDVDAEASLSDAQSDLNAAEFENTQVRAEESALLANADGAGQLVSSDSDGFDVAPDVLSDDDSSVRNLSGRNFDMSGNSMIASGRAEDVQLFDDNSQPSSPSRVRSVPTGESYGRASGEDRSRNGRVSNGVSQSTTIDSSPSNVKSKSSVASNVASSNNAQQPVASGRAPSNTVLQRTVSGGASQNNASQRTVSGNVTQKSSGSVKSDSGGQRQTSNLGESRSRRQSVAQASVVNSNKPVASGSNTVVNNHANTNVVVKHGPDSRVYKSSTRIDSRMGDVNMHTTDVSGDVHVKAVRNVKAQPVQHSNAVHNNKAVTDARAAVINQKAAAVRADTAARKAVVERMRGQASSVATVQPPAAKDSKKVKNVIRRSLDKNAGDFL